MSDLMLLGVLRMPVTPDSDHLTLKQYIDRGRQAADLIERQKKRNSELEATVERLREACFSQRARLKGTIGTLSRQPNECKSRQNLNAIKREAFIEGFNAGFTDCLITDEEEHADAAIEIVNQRYPD